MKQRRRLSVGLDSSTQSITAVAIDIDRGEVVGRHTVDYAKDSRLNGYGIHHAEYIVPPREPGEADQPPDMYLASIDALFADLRDAGIEPSEVVVINDSGQQHGHLYLGQASKRLFGALQKKESKDHDLVYLLSASFSYGTAPIWKTSNTGTQADAIRQAVGGKEQMIRLSGSDSPLRFTGAVIRRVGEQFPALYLETEVVQLISSFIPAVLVGDHRVPWDFGNASGTSLMDYSGREWSQRLISAVSKGLPGGAESLRSKLPALAAPYAVVGRIASYFAEKYGFPEACVVCAGSGDNPQTKVLVKGDLLSLGTSFVNMVSTDGKTFDLDGYANGMYDGIGRPFMFGCRTNGAMVWDGVRALHHLHRDDYATADDSLNGSAPGSRLFIWQPDNESFPPSGTIPPTRVDYAEPDLASDYAGVIDSSLGIVYLYSRGFARQDAGPIYVTGGVAKVDNIVRRVAGVWNRPVVTIGTVGAALGAAVAGAVALARSAGDTLDADQLSTSVLPRAAEVEPRPADVQAYHGEDGYLSRLEREYGKLIGA